jgi:hypothetical protein
MGISVKVDNRNENNEQTKYKFFILVNSSIHLATLHIPDDTYERGNPGES